MTNDTIYAAEADRFWHLLGQHYANGVKINEIPRHQV